jgi:hypothetical protein
MPAFGPTASYTDRLSDNDVADVSNYVLTQFGNPDVKVTAQDVARIRDGGDKPLIAKLAPYAVPIAIAAALIVLAALAFALRRQTRRAVA